MRAELELPERMKAGDAIPITVRARNDGTEPAELSLTGRPVAIDLVVQRLDGTEVWRRLHGQVVNMMLQVTVLQPGEDLEFEYAWMQRDNTGRPVTPGTYQVRGVLPLADGPLFSEARWVEIVA